MESLRRQLQEKIGAAPIVEIESFVNWSKTQKVDAVLAIKPKTIPEVQSIIKAAHALNLRVRCAAATHSWSPLFADEGQVLVYTRDIQSDYENGLQITKQLAPDGTPLASVMCGVTTGEFMDYQLENKVCLPSNVILRSATIVGVVLTGSHGVGNTESAVSDYVVSMRIIDSEGQIKTYSNSVIMKAVRCNLGLFGIVIDVTLKMKEMFMVKTDNQYATVREIFYNPTRLKNLVKDNWSVELFWFPFNGISRLDALEAALVRKLGKEDWDPLDDKIWARVINPEKNPQGNSVGRRFYKWHEIQDSLQAIGLDVVDELLVRHPHKTPKFTRTSFIALMNQYDDNTDVIQEITQAVHYRDEVQNTPVLNFEFSIDVDESFDNISKCIQFLVNEIRDEAGRGRFPVNLTLEMRFTSHSDTFLSSATSSNPDFGGSGISCHIGLVTLLGTPGAHETFLRVAKNWLSHQRVIPHLGKMWTFIDGIDDHFRKAYGKNLDEFRDALDKSKADPDGMFLNSQLQQLLFPVLNKQQQKYERNIPNVKSDSSGICCCLL